MDSSIEKIFEKLLQERAAICKTGCSAQIKNLSHVSQSFRIWKTCVIPMADRNTQRSSYFGHYYTASLTAGQPLVHYRDDTIK